MMKTQLISYWRGKIVDIDMVADAARLAQLDLTVLSD